MLILITLTNYHADDINTTDVIDIDPVVVGAPNLNDYFNEDHYFNILSPIDRGRWFKLVHLNVCSLPQKVDQIRIVLRETTIDHGSRYGGGVALYVRDSM